MYRLNTRTLFFSLGFYPSVTFGQFIATNLNNSGTGSLREAIDQANAEMATATIGFNILGGGTIDLASMLPIFKNPNGISIDGANSGQGAITINGGSSSWNDGDRVFFIGVNQDVASVSPELPATTSTTWSISNLTITGGNARGGDGGRGLGAGSGGGGAGLGGGIFVNAGQLNLSYVNLIGNKAKGGSGATDNSCGYITFNSPTIYASGGGGGGMGGDGYRAGYNNSGGGGGFGAGAALYFTFGLLPPGAFTGASNNGGGPGRGNYYLATNGGVGGFGGGGGGNTTSAFLSPTFGSTFWNSNAIGSIGGYGGGGGSGAAGGFGGGGGGGLGGLSLGSGELGGVGGFGGGVGSRGTFFGSSSFPNSDGGAGGGGAGLGAGIFVRQGASIRVVNCNLSGNSVYGGGSMTPDAANLGQGIGQGLFLAGSAIYEVASGNTITMNDTLGGGSHSLITGGFNKTGAGNLILGGINSHVGSTLVSAGTLTINGSTSSETSFTVAPGANLSGSGTVGGSVSVAGSINPGNSIGNLTTGSIAGTGTYLCETTAAATDKLVVTGSVNLVGMTFSLSGLDLFPANTTRLVLDKTSVGPITGIFSDLPEGKIITSRGQDLRVSYLGGDGNDLSLTSLTAPQVTPIVTSFAVSPSSNTINSPMSVTVNFSSLPNQSGLTLQTSTDMINWTTFMNGALPMTWSTNNSGLVTIQGTIPGTSQETTPRLFLRVVNPAP